MLIKFGNHKLGKDTLIFNMETATHCPSRKLGICPVVNAGLKCYAHKAEITYKNVVPQYRKRQRIYWRTTSKDKILDYFSKYIDRRKIETKYFRYNESGDFRDQKDIAKLDYISDKLKERHGIVTYGYTARKDLIFKDIGFLVKGSGWNAKNGKTMIINKNQKAPKNFFVCPANCKICDTCKQDNKINIAFHKH